MATALPTRTGIVEGAIDPGMRHVLPRLRGHPSVAPGAPALKIGQRVVCGPHVHQFGRISSFVKRDISPVCVADSIWETGRVEAIVRAWCDGGDVLLGWCRTVDGRGEKLAGRLVLPGDQSGFAADSMARMG